VVLDGVDLEVPPGTVCALLGPSGSGKSTLLRCVAGLEVPEAGRISAGGTVLTDGASVVPPERRGVGMVFQDWALFPHLDVAANVGFGLPRAERSGPRVDDVLALVGLGGYRHRAPATLSGGQQQRVALARALAPEPSVLLLDERFSNLDTNLRSRIRGEVRELLLEVGITTLFVTHDRVEAFVLGDTVALVHEGRVVQHGTPEEVYRRPVDPWAAAFVGDANIVPGRASGAEAETPLGTVALASPVSGAVRVLVRPEDVVVTDGDAAGAGGTVAAAEFHGHDVVLRLRVDGLGEEVAARVQRTSVRAGDRVGVTVAGAPAVAWAVAP
jgi:iron(III) transport system ATP-binding protein